MLLAGCKSRSGTRLQGVPGQTGERKEVQSRVVNTGSSTTKSLPWEELVPRPAMPFIASMYLHLNTVVFLWAIDENVNPA